MFLFGFSVFSKWFLCFDFVLKYVFQRIIHRINNPQAKIVVAAGLPSFCSSHNTLVFGHVLRCPGAFNSVRISLVPDM